MELGAALDPVRQEMLTIWEVISASQTANGKSEGVGSESVQQDQQFMYLFLCVTGEKAISIGNVTNATLGDNAGNIASKNTCNVSGESRPSYCWQVNKNKQM